MQIVAKSHVSLTEAGVVQLTTRERSMTQKRRSLPAKVVFTFGAIPCYETRLRRKETGTQ